MMYLLKNKMQFLEEGIHLHKKRSHNCSTIRKICNVCPMTNTMDL